MRSRLNQRLTRYGFKVKPIGNFINGTFQRRPDILSVQYHGVPVMVIPKRIYGFPNRFHRDLIGNEMPDYFTLEHRLRSWNHRIKTTDWLKQQHDLTQKSL